MTLWLGVIDHRLVRQEILCFFLLRNPLIFLRLRRCHFPNAKSPGKMLRYPIKHGDHLFNQHTQSMVFWSPPAVCVCACVMKVWCGWLGVLQGELSLSCVIQLEFCATRHKNDTVSPAFYALIQDLYHECVWQRRISFHEIYRFTFILKCLHVHCARSTLIRRTFCTYVTLSCVSSWDMNVVPCVTLLTLSTNAECNLSSILVVLKVCVCSVWGSECTPASSGTLLKIACLWQ